MALTNDPYTTLGLQPGATRREVRAAYRRLAARYHPDHYPPEQRAWALEKMVALNAAKETLLHAPHAQRSPTPSGTPPAQPTAVPPNLRATPPAPRPLPWWREHLWLLALGLGVGLWGGFILLGQAQWGAMAFGYAALIALFGAPRRN